MKIAQVLLHSPGAAQPTAVGWLSAFGQVYRLQFDERYIEAPDRATLSQVYMGAGETQTQAILRARDDERLVGTGRLPAYFENLLPEGENRERLAQRRGCSFDEQLDPVMN